MAEPAELGRAWRAEAPAKLNLGLRVLGRRPDGFHEIDTVMAALDLRDELVSRAGGDRDALERVEVGDEVVDGASLPLGPDNLVLRALAAYRAAASRVGARPPPAQRVMLRKRVPLAAGLGGGSSDAAAVLRACADAYPASVDLLALARDLGSDVPFFVSRHPFARAVGRGERLAPVDITPAVALLLKPVVGVSAGDAYRWWGGGSAGERSAPPLPWHGLDLANDLEPAVAARVGEVAEALRWLRERAPGPVAMSGSGSTCYALLDEASTAASLAAAARAADRWWVRTVRLGAGLSVSPPG